MSRPDKEMEERLTAAGISLLQTPLLHDELLALLDQIWELLQKVDQTPARSIYTSLSPLMKALVVEELLKHSDVDVKTGIACCISEIIRITAPDAPYDDDIMKDVFQLIVSSFENLPDMSSRSYDKRTIMLETMARVRFCVIMLDLECDQMIIEMFRHFLKAIRVDHPEVVFGSMETIMSRVLEESENICPDLLIPILDTLKMNNEAVMPVARKLAERVIQNSADRVGPYLVQTVKEIDADFNEFGKVVALVCRGSTDTVSISRDQSDKVTSPRSHLKSLKDEETPGLHSKGKRTRGTVKDADVEHSYHDTSSDAQRRKKKEGNTNSESSKSSKRQKTYGSPKSKLKDTATESGGKSKDDGKPESEVKVKPGSNYVDDAAIKPRELEGESQNGKILTKTSSSTIVKRSGITLPKTTTSSKEPNTIKYDDSLIGSKVKVWWSYYKRFYEGVITSFDHVKRKHKVCYADGDVELLNLRRERWEFVGDDSVLNGDAVVELSRHDTSSDAQRKKKKEGNTNSESSKSSKLKDTATKSGGKSNDDGNPKSEMNIINSEPIINNVDDAALKPQELGGKSQGDSAKTSSHPTNQDSQRSSAESKGKTPQSGNTLTIASSSTKVKESGKALAKTTSSSKVKESGKALAKTPSHPTNQDSQRSSAESKGKTPQSGNTLTIASSSTKVEESGKALAKTTSSSKGGEGNNSIWPAEGTLHHHAIKSTLRRLSQMLDEGIHAGVTIITSNGSLKAHKSILSTSSPVFHSMFQREKVSTVEMKEMTSESCMTFLSFLYGSPNQEAFLRHRLDLLGAANKYGIVDLKDACEQSLLEDVNSGNVLERLQQAWVYKLEELKKGCFTYLMDSGKISDVREMMNEFFKQADRGLLVEMFQEVLAALKQN